MNSANAQNFQTRASSFRLHDRAPPQPRALTGNRKMSPSSTHRATLLTFCRSMHRVLRSAMWQKDNWQKAVSHEGCGEAIVAGLGKGWGQCREALSRGRERTEYFAPVRTRCDCCGTRFQRSDCSNSGIHLRYVTTAFKSRASQGLPTDVLHSWWKSPLPPQIRPMWSEI